MVRWSPGTGTMSTLPLTTVDHPRSRSLGNLSELRSKVTSPTYGRGSQASASTLLCSAIASMSATKSSGLSPVSGIFCSAKIL
jgi:hypothetical protein